jgi:hypothetical protein
MNVDELTNVSQDDVPEKVKSALATQPATVKIEIISDPQNLGNWIVKKYYY